MNQKTKLSRKTILLLFAALGFNFLVYYAGRLLAQGKIHHDITTAIDRKIPFLPCMVWIYWACYLFWAINYYICIKEDKNKPYQFLLAHVIGEVVCFLVFVFFPTALVRPEITGDGFFNLLLKITYTVDEPNNLLPSIHCFVSWLCWIGVRKHPKVPIWYQWVSFVCAVAVCVCTLTIRQHVLLDVITGVLLAEVSYVVAGRLLILGRT
ncbi:MAG: phosphatase PAP2 family protein [Lachnospiraceae bacterium]|nr:phosphatase PAP2 family protein [Lachnospiraceae bacterium]